MTGVFMPQSGQYCQCCQVRLTAMRASERSPECKAAIGALYRSHDIMITPNTILGET